ncbi:MULTISPECIES: DapH/DapD/GlmU-related protein [unclassified Micromonospora]|uniref:DapH/DapD/GlmU-related protein n=1 Tax=unclassified Micromonospora TaxID=2617518 RepID=UPI0036A3395D
MSSDRLMRIHSAGFQAMAERVLRVTELTSRLNGPKATFITVGHPVDPEERRGWLSGAPIDVAENVWIGAGATILPGVSIGRDAVVAAGAVVTDDVPPASLVTGNKATVHRRW